MTRILVLVITVRSDNTLLPPVVVVPGCDDANKASERREEMKDGVVLMYMKEGVLYPVVLTEEQNETLQFTAQLFSPLRVVTDRPQGQAINLAEK